MQRLSSSPYQILRLHPGSDTLPFTIADATAKSLSGKTLKQLFQDGRIFYADYRDQQDLIPNAGRYTANSDAYFYIHPKSGDFLPLAIRTNVGANLTYTPLDGPGEWLLAKMMVNVNDFWFAQWNHLAATHEVAHIVWMAAIRSLSQEHPVYAVLSRVMHQVFSIQILAAATLFSPGGTVDSFLAFSGPSAQNYTTAQYFSGQGKFKANYFRENLKRRGLIDSKVGPSLNHFPFYEDAGKIHGAIHNFMTSFVNSYYSSDGKVASDAEIQDWVKEANGPAKVLDFPANIKKRSELVDVLTHLVCQHASLCPPPICTLLTTAPLQAHLASTAHHTVNTNELLAVSSALPFHPPALYKPLPTTKNTTLNPVEWLPPLDKAFEQFVVGAMFARPQFAGTNRTILHMFDDPSLLGRLNNATRNANGVFMDKMQRFSDEVSGRGFDNKGLSQGMPIVWRALDPNVAPFNVAT